MASTDGEAKLVAEDGKAVAAEGGADKVKDGGEGTGKRDRSSRSKSPEKLKTRYMDDLASGFRISRIHICVSFWIYSWASP